MSCGLDGVDHTHSLANLAKRLVRDLVRAAVAVGQDVGDIRRIPHKLLAARANGCEIVVHALGDVLLERARAAVADFLRDLDFRTPGAKRRGGEQGGHTRAIVGIEGDVAVGVGLRLLDELCGLLADGVPLAERLMALP